MVDPYALLGLHPGATPQEAAAAYRRLAKRLHPDVAAGAGAQGRMAEVNSAYALVRDELSGVARRGPGASAQGPSGTAAAAVRRSRLAGSWLPDEIRGALPLELLEALERDEQVELVVGPQPWAGPELVLALTDRRLLWLADERVLGRVRSLPYLQIREVERKLRGRGARRAGVHVRTVTEARYSFPGLAPAVAEDVTARVRARLRSRPAW